MTSNYQTITIIARIHLYKNRGSTGNRWQNYCKTNTKWTNKETLC